MPISPNLKGILYAIASGICFGAIGYFGMHVVDAGFSVPTMLFWRFFLSGIILGLFLLILPQLWQGTCTKDALRMFFYGASTYSLSALAYFLASTYIGTGLSMVIFFTYPTMVVIVNSVLLGAMIKRKDYAACILLSIGVIFLLDTSMLQFNMLGIVLALLTAVFYVAYIILGRNNTLHPVLATFWLLMGCSLTCFFTAWGLGEFKIPQTAAQWFSIISFAVVCTSLPMLLFRNAIQYISTDKASMLSVLEPAFVVMIGIVALDEYLDVWQLCGVAIIMTSAVLTLMGHGNQNKKNHMNHASSKKSRVTKGASIYG